MINCENANIQPCLPKICTCPTVPAEDCPFHHQDACGSLAAMPCSAWRDPLTDAPTNTGKILIWIEGIGPSIVNVEERWMCYWNSNHETDPTAPHEWDWWMEISPPNV